MVPDQPARRTSLAMLDGFAVAASVACMVHCLALPLALAMLPVLAETLLASEAFHVIVLLLAIPTSAVALWSATRRPDGKVCLAVGAAGLMLMAGGLAMPTESAEKAATVAGSLLLAGAHLANWRARGGVRQPA